MPEALLVPPQHTFVVILSTAAPQRTCACLHKQYSCCFTFPVLTACIMPVCATPQDEDKVYIVQELCTGGTLCDHLKAKGPCSEHEAANIMQGVLDLLVECHRRQICYGDLKPANIMFSGNAQQQQHQRPQVRAIDFGSSNSARGRALTQVCSMSPEGVCFCLCLRYIPWCQSIFHSVGCFFGVSGCIHSNC